MESAKVVNIIPKRLYWVCDTYPPDPIKGVYVFCVDSVSYMQVLAYQPFVKDFGPVDISKIHKYCCKLNNLLEANDLKTYKLYHYTGTSPIKKNNSVLMLTAYLVMVLHYSPKDAFSLFSSIYFPEFRDASKDATVYYCSILQCLNALKRSISLSWYNFQTFDCQSYEYFSNIKNGDMNWIVPNKLLAFSDPGKSNTDICIRNLHKLGISTIIRVNRKTYPADKFRKQGFKHHDLFFQEGACPSEDLLRKFLSIAESEQGAIAVHCKAGLGLTGTLIACYIMKHFEYPAAEVIPWVRMCRPGSILGSQQLFIVEIEETCYKWGEAFKKSAGGFNIFGGKNLEDRIPMRRKSFDLRKGEKRKEPKEKGLEKLLINAKFMYSDYKWKSIEDRDALSPPISYRKKADKFRATFMNLSSCFFYKENLSITLASPGHRVSNSVSL